MTIIERTDEVKYSNSKVESQAIEYLKRNFSKVFDETLDMIVEDKSIKDDSYVSSRIINSFVKHQKNKPLFEIETQRFVGKMKDIRDGKLESDKEDEVFSFYEKLLEVDMLGSINDKFRSSVSIENFSYDTLLDISGISWNTVDKLYLAIKSHKQLDNVRLKAFVDWMLFNKKATDGSILWLTKSEITQGIRENLNLSDSNIEKIDEIVDNKIISDHSTVTKITPEYSGLNENVYASTKIYQQFNSVFMNIRLHQEYGSSITLDEKTKNEQKEKIAEVIKEVESEQGFKYTDEQTESIYEMWDSNIYMLKGVAGSGKTSVIRGFIKTVRRLNPSDIIYGVSFTGKASANLKQLAKLEDGEWSTLSRWMALNKNKSDSKNTTGTPNFKEVNLLIIDEFSMIDLDLIAKAINKIDVSTKVIFVGDLAQLPPINVSVASELDSSNVLKSRELLHIQRQDDDTINTISNEIRVGKIPELFESSNKSSNFSFTSTRRSKFGVNVLNIYQDYVRNKGVKIDDIRVVANTNATTDELNLSIQQARLDNNDFDLEDNHYQVKSFMKEPEHISFRVGERVVAKENTKGSTIDSLTNENDRQWLIKKLTTTNTIDNKWYFNGAVGTIIRIILTNSQHNTYNNEVYNVEAVIVHFDEIGDVIVSSADDIFGLKLGYATTVHKSQGMTIPHVIGAIQYSKMLNTRQLLYTLTSRSSMTLDIVSTTATLSAMIKNDYYSNARNIYKQILNVENNQKNDDLFNDTYEDHKKETNSDVKANKSKNDFSDLVERKVIDKNKPIRKKIADELYSQQTIEEEQPTKTEHVENAVIEDDQNRPREEGESKNHYRRRRRKNRIADINENSI